MNRIAVSILNCNFGKLQEEIEMVNRSAAEWFHMDVMDGVFVPNISFGFPIIEAVKKIATKPLDTHLMLASPDPYIKKFREVGSDRITVHFEACKHLHRTVQSIKLEGAQAGVSLNPHSPVSFLEDIITDIDLVLLMSVNPGFGGQKFIEHTYEKVSRLKELILRKNSSALIEIDGGIDTHNIGKLVQAGGDVFVVGSKIFRSENPTLKIKELTEAM